MVTDVPTAPLLGSRFVRTGIGTVKLKPLLASPTTVTTMFPVVAPDGTGTTMLVMLQLLGVAATPLNLSVLLPCEEPKFEPEIVTIAPGIPEEGETLEITGVGAEPTVNGNALLTNPSNVVKTTGPVVAPVGTSRVTLVLEFQCVVDPTF